MRTAGITASLAAVAAVVFGPSALAAPAIVNVRVEGKTQTLFEGPVRTDGHAVRASSDTQSRACDGTNGGAHATPGPTPTAATVDAMTIAGQTFDGTWSSGFDDYFITRWGPDKHNVEEGQDWGLVVDRVLIPKGGCQRELEPTDQVLWAYNAFSKAPFLTLAAGGDSSEPHSMIATAKLDQPFTVKVGAYTSSEGSGQDLGPQADVEVSPVSTDANGFQSLETASPLTVTTAPDGTATALFTTPGWHRLKASASEAFRSNRLDVCVPPEGDVDCGALPADDRVREAGSTPPLEEPPPSPPNPEQPDPSQTGARGPTVTTQTTVGTGVLGSSQSRPTQLALQGHLLTPIDDRSSGLVYTGRWRSAGETDAWLGTLRIGVRGATLTFHLNAGRPVLILRNVRHRARVAVMVGKRRQTFTIPGSSTHASRLVIGVRRAHAGTVQVRILKGTVGIDGVALVS